MKGAFTKTQKRSFLYSSLLVLCASLFLPVQSLAGEPFLQPGANVLLLSGLAGDLESESSYRDQLQSWLEILGAAGVLSIHVLADNPGPLASTIDAQPASRSNFLALAASLKGQTNALLVIAWGHGGRQGVTPVFHVRGPRITPSDFRTLASEAPSSKSLLFFRGSGAFARETAGPDRQIISSDAEAGFSSDPIGLPLAAKVLKSQSSLTMPELAEQLGLAISSWYKDRNLARTEEPALWTGDGPPRLLAKKDQENSLASTAQAETTQTNPPAESNPSSSETKTNQPSSRSSTAWPGSQKVQPRDYPEEDAVVLRRRVTYTLAANPALASEHDEFVQVLTLEGKHFGDFDVSYSPPAEDITFLDCEVQRPDGTTATLDPDAIREARDESVGEYQMGRRKFFSLPGVVPGAILHVRYRTVWKQFPLPHISLQIPLAQEIPTRDLELEITAPKDAPFHFGFEGLSEHDPDQSQSPHASRITHHDHHHDPTIRQSTYGSTYTWNFTNLPALKHEVLTAPHHGSRLIVSTFPDWGAFAEWYARISKLTDEVTPAISARAAELVRDAKSDREKVIALYHFVTGLRYVAVPLGVNSFRPHAAEKVLQNQFGDCKDKANLFNALLRSVNLSADLVLVPRFAQARESLPGFAFNHAISRVTLDGEPLWIDTTDDVCRFGLLPPGDPGRNVLVIAPGTNTLTQLPVPDASRHSLKITGEVNCSESLQAVPVTFNLIASGYPDYELRETARETKEASASLPLLAARFRPASGTFALDKQTATSVAALDQDFSWKGDGTILGITSPNAAEAARSQIALRAPFWIPKEWDLALHRREASLFLNQGYPLTLEQKLQFQLPPNPATVALPAAAQNTQPPLRWRINWDKANQQLTATFHAELVSGELNETETRAFQEQLRRLLASLAQSAEISR